MSEQQQLGLTIPDAVVEAIAEAVGRRVLACVDWRANAENWPEWMSIETAARYLDVSPQRLRKQVARREVPFHQEDKGCRVYFSRRDLDDWMAGFRVAPRSESRRVS